MSYVSEVLADSPVAWWTQSEASGSTMVDVIAGQNGAYFGSPTLGEPGLIPGAPSNTSVEFNGTSQYARVADAAFLDAAAVTVEVWFSTPGGTSWNHLVYRWDGFDFYLNQDTGNLAFSWSGTGDETATAVTLDDSHHAVLACDGTNLKVYLDGVEIYSNTGFSPLSPVAQPLVISAAQYPTTPTEFFEGNIGGVVFYDYMLDGARVAAHYAAGITPAPPEGSLAASAPVVASFAGTFAGPSLSGSVAARNAVPLPAFAGTYLGAVPADTSNFMSGLSIGASASVTVTVPLDAPSPSGIEFDVAIPLPTPTIVDGRPT